VNHLLRKAGVEVVVVENGQQATALVARYAGRREAATAAAAI
jgi:hypothetical protein